jgi:hypothetical protein
MIDINIIKAGNKTYSIKSRIEHNIDEMKVVILNVDEVSLTSNTSYTKLKTIWTNPTGNAQFETIKYNDIYQAIIKRLISKYKMKKLII